MGKSKTQATRLNKIMWWLLAAVGLIGLYSLSTVFLGSSRGRIGIVPAELQSSPFVATNYVE